MKVGTLDSLMALSDELVKVDVFVENVVKKTEKTLFDIMEKADAGSLGVEGFKSGEGFIESFEWKADRFNPGTSLKELSNAIYDDTQKCDEDLKAKLIKFNDTKALLAAIDRKESSSLALKPLSGLNPQDVMFNKEIEFPMFSTLLVVVPKQREKEFLDSYEKIDSMFAAEHAARLEELGSKKSSAKDVVEEVKEEEEKKEDKSVAHMTPEEQKLHELEVKHKEAEKRREVDRLQRKEQRDKVCNNVVPKSAKQLAEDEEYKLFRVFVLAKGVEQFKAACKDRRYIVRNPEISSQEDTKSDKEKRTTLVQEQSNQKTNLIKWCKTSYSELFVSWSHIKAIRVFVESVLRYGLPVNFVAAAVKPTPQYDKKLRQVLLSMYSNLGGSHLAAQEEEASDASGMGEYYPYVSINMEFVQQQSD